MNRPSSGYPSRVAARAILAQLARASARQFTTRYILAETHALVVARRRNAREALALIIKFSLTDAISFAVMERFRITDAFTFDGDFSEFGVNVLTADSL